MEAAPVLALLRAVHVAAMLSLLGTQAFMTWLLPDPPQRLRRALWRVALGSGILTLLAGVLWLVLQAAAIAEAHAWPELREALPLVLAHTQFGQLVSFRLLLLGISTGLIAVTRTSPAPVIAVAPTAIAAGLQGLIGHAGAGDNTQLLLSEALHVLAAGLWLGSLLPLCLSIQSLPRAVAARLCERFTPMGLGCVLVLAGTGLAQAFVLVGDTHALLTSAYGQLVLGKVGLFLTAVSLAACNRLLLSDRLAAGRSRSRRHLLISVAAETSIGLAIVTVAAVLASTMPGADHPAALSARLAAAPSTLRASASCCLPPSAHPEITL